MSLFESWKVQPVNSKHGPLQNPHSVYLLFLVFALNATFQVVHISSPVMLLASAIYDSDPIPLEMQNDLKNTLIIESSIHI